MGPYHDWIGQPLVPPVSLEVIFDDGYDKGHPKATDENHKHSANVFQTQSLGFSRLLDGLALAATFAFLPPTLFYHMEFATLLELEDSAADGSSVGRVWSK